MALKLPLHKLMLLLQLLMLLEEGVLVGIQLSLLMLYLFHLLSRAFLL